MVIGFAIPLTLFIAFVIILSLSNFMSIEYVHNVTVFLMVLSVVIGVIIAAASFNEFKSYNGHRGGGFTVGIVLGFVIIIAILLIIRSTSTDYVIIEAANKALTFTTYTIVSALITAVALIIINSLMH